MRDTIAVHGARENNLANVDVEIPRDKLVVVTGVSGSGKSSLAFDTVFAVDRLAAIETLLHGEAPGREVIYQGIKYNPQFFNAIYTELMDKKKTKRSIEAALKRVDQYLCDKAELLFKPLLEYLEEADGMRTMGEIDEHFSKVGIGGLDFACEWLVEKGLIDKLSAPIHRNEKSRIQMDEPAYYLDSEGAIF